MRGLAGALVAAVLASAAADQVPYCPTDTPAPGPSVCPGGLCQPDAMNGVFEALARAEAGAATAPVHILQIGDSHTAGDRITGKLRAALQARFGDGGRGVLPPGIPYAGYAPLQVEVTTDGWTTTLAPLAGNAGYVRAGVGLTGVQAVTVQPGSTLTFRREAVSPAFIQIGLCGEGPGRLEVTADGEAWTVAFGAKRCAILYSYGRPRQIEPRALDWTLSLHAVRPPNTAPGGDPSIPGLRVPHNHSAYCTSKGPVPPCRAGECRSPGRTSWPV